VLNHREARQVGGQLRNLLARQRQVLKNESDRRRAVVRELDARDDDAAAAFAADDGAVLEIGRASCRERV